MSVDIENDGTGDHEQDAEDDVPENPLALHAEVDQVTLPFCRSLPRGLGCLF